MPSSQSGVDALTEFTAEALVIAEEKGCEDMLGFATSAVRDAVNSDEVLEHVRERTGVVIDVLAGEDEARLTFLAVRRWFGWSAGRLAVFDIGGGSLEIAGGATRRPTSPGRCRSGAARLARSTSPGAADEETVPDLRREIRAEIARDAGHLLRAGRPDRAAATSKTFRSLGRICGTAAVGRRSAGAAHAAARRAARVDPQAGRDEARRPAPTCPASRRAAAHQIVPGALVAEACMDIFDLTELEICPWALREGVILERLDQMSVLDRS